MINAIEHMIAKSTVDIKTEPSFKQTAYETNEATINTEATADQTDKHSPSRNIDTNTSKTVAAVDEAAIKA